MARVFFRIGARAVGGWSTTALLLEKEFVEQRSMLTAHQLQGAVAYAQVLPGATQVALVASVGYKLRGVRCAVLAALCYIAPAVCLVTGFAAVYFHYLQGPQLMRHMGGLIAALGGLMLANAYQIAKRHATQGLLWLLIAAVFVVRVTLHINPVFIILSFGIGGLIFSWASLRRVAS